MTKPKTSKVRKKGTRSAVRPPTAFALTPYERLFFECVLEAIAEHGIAPPLALGLPSSIGRVVDYDHVKAFMARKMLREDDNTDEGKKRHRERVKSALKRARENLTAFKVVGVDNPFIWWTGKAVRGFEHRLRHAA